MTTFIKCADVRAGDHILVGRLLFHVKHTQLSPSTPGRVLVQAERLAPLPEAPRRAKNRWMTWNAEATCARVDASKAGTPAVTPGVAA